MLQYMSTPYQTIINVPTYKKYYVSRIPFRDKSIYNGDVEWVANWFYNNIEIHTDNILIEITGDFHQTFPNPPHLSIRFNYNKSWTPMYHISVDPNGFIYAQVLNSDLPYTKGNGKGKSKSKRKSKKRKSKKRRSKKGGMDLVNLVWPDPVQEPVPVPVPYSAPEPEPEPEPEPVPASPIPATRLSEAGWVSRRDQQFRQGEKTEELSKKSPKQGSKVIKVTESMGPTRRVQTDDGTHLNIQVLPNLGGARLSDTEYSRFMASQNEIRGLR